MKPKPFYESEDVQAYWDVSIYVEYSSVRANRVDARFVDHKAMRVLAVEMSCPWLDNRAKEDSEKEEKYQPLLHDGTVERHRARFEE